MLRRPNFLPLVACALAILAACSGGDKDERTEPATVKATNRRAALVAGTATAETTGPDVQVDEPTKQAIVAVAQQYVDAALLAPLENGSVNDRYAPLFDDGVRAAATGPDAAVLTFAPVGKVDEYEQTATPVAISALADAGGTLVYASAKFAVTVRAGTASGPGDFVNDVELTLVPAGGGWQVTAYRVGATRSVGGSTTSTTAVSAP